MEEVILIQPECFHPTSKLTWDYIPPMGILYIAAVLKRKGFKVKVIDMMSERNTNIDVILSNFINSIISMSFLLCRFKESTFIDSIDRSFRNPVILGEIFSSIRNFILQIPVLSLWVHQRNRYLHSAQVLKHNLYRPGYLFLSTGDMFQEFSQRNF